ncbi:MAG: nucleotidyl transferase AbiEii/AbiGii toxin family protein [Chlamydiae bacterium]|nr:nucleotidyl transferase AbiEii/AbiGii toxin family protein [Chlamydiota bacterium]
MLTEEQLQNLSRRFQIDIFSILREYLQLLFLKIFYELKGSEKVYFKGGTAIHFLYGSFRFSEDLDFTISSRLIRLQDLLKEMVGRMSYEIPSLKLIQRDSPEGGLH